MQTQASGDLVVVSLAEGEEILTALREAAEHSGIEAGTFTGIGAVSEVEIAFFDPAKREYVPRTFKEPMEIGMLVGNISQMDGATHVHAHITVAGPELLAFTGHLNRGVVGTACEVYLRKFPQAVKRVKNPEAGFNPLELG